MRVINQSIKTVSIDQLQPHPDNPRKGDLDTIVESIDANGFYGAIVAQKSTGYILAGNHRYMAAKNKGAKEIPVAWVDVDEDQARRILLADNRTSDLGGYDEELLAELLQGVNASIGLYGTGYDESDLDALLDEQDSHGEESSIDDSPDALELLLEKWNVVTGQVWEAGSHRIMCGSSTSKADVDLLLDGNVPSLMVTDPPYGVEYDPTWRDQAAKEGKIAAASRRRGKVENDDRADWSDAWTLFPGNVVYCWHASSYTDVVKQSFEKCKFEVRSQIIWTKERFAISRGHYHWKHEPCWYLVKKGRTADWIGDRSQTTVWDISTQQFGDQDMKEHGTQKPMECMERPIRHHSGDVYEPFAGSGTTIIAAEKQGRSCFAMELSPGYVALILERLKLYGLSPVLVKEV